MLDFIHSEMQSKFECFESPKSHSFETVSFTQWELFVVVPKWLRLPVNKYVFYDDGYNYNDL